jgi:precorrin-6B C5,15-methyltransferase / cobalt-precorrin-6B C5,C15-methyltransferase
MPNIKRKITIIGTGLTPEDISPLALRAVESADILIGGKRQLSFFRRHRGEKIQLKRGVDAFVKGLGKKLKGKKTVVLASGDPNFFGIASVFYKTFDRKHISVLPNITAFQGAFARIKEPWDSAVFVSVHGRELSLLDKVVNDEGTFVVYCDSTNSPAKAAEYLISRDKELSRCRTWIFENLGGEDEKVVSGALQRFRKHLSSSLCMMIIKKEWALYRPGLGIPDNEFYHHRGMITKKDVRILSLLRLNLNNKKVLWDVGAGSGSVSVEAAGLCPSLNIYAVERSKERFDELRKNLNKFKTPNINLVYGIAPDALKKLPLPDSVFIGGAGKSLEKILFCVKTKINPGGHVVINCVKMETLYRALDLFKKWKWQYDITELHISRLESDRNPEIFRAENPVFILHGHREKKANGQGAKRQ